MYVPDNRTGRDPFAALTAAVAPRQSSFVCANLQPAREQQDDEVSRQNGGPAGRRLDPAHEPGDQERLGWDADIM